MRKPVSGLMLTVLMLVGSLATSGYSATGSSINRCFGNDNVPVFTDRDCASIGKSETIAPSRLVPRVEDCSRRVEALKASIQSALAAGDVNQFAGLYHWTGTSAYTAGALMPIMEQLVQGSLADMGIESDDFEDGEPPTRLWLDLFDPGRPGETIRTRFSLVMTMGCWWLHHFPPPASPQR